MKILVVLPRFPYPLEKGDKLRAFHQIEYLSKSNEVHLFCVSHSKVAPADVDKLRPYCASIRIVQLNRLVCCKNVVRNFFYSKSLQIGYWDSQKSRSAFKAYEREVQPDVIYSQMVRTMPLVSRSLVPKVMDFQDALSMNTERRMDTVRRGFWHWALHYEFKMLRSSEYNAFKIFDDLVIISEVDSEAVPRRKNADIQVVPNGVDFDYFKPIQMSKEYDLVFCGNMQYGPNVDAAHKLVSDVMPIIWQKHPQARLLIAGASPKSSIRSLASDKVIVSGWVDDIRQCYAQAKVFAAPMNMGSGLQNKLLEAMAMQIPCVTTSIANDSLGAQPESQVLIGDERQQFADQVIRLLDDEALRHQIALSGHEFVKHHYDWNVFGAKLEGILANVAQHPSKVSLEPSPSKHL